MTQHALAPEHDRAPQLSPATSTLFEAVASRLPSHARRLLELAAAYHAAARQAGGERADRVGRDMALAAPIEGLRPHEQAIVASAVALQREKPRPSREPAFLWLGEKDKRTALRLAAILRV